MKPFVAPVIDQTLSISKHADGRRSVFMYYTPHPHVSGNSYLASGALWTTLYVEPRNRHQYPVVSVMCQI